MATSRKVWRQGPGCGRRRLAGRVALFARIDNCRAKVLFEAATGRLF